MNPRRIGFVLAIAMPMLVGNAEAQVSTEGVRACRAGEIDELIGQLSIDEGLLDIELEPARREWRVGERVTIRVAVRATGRLTLLMIDPQGDAMTLFPNPYFNANDSNIVIAGTRLTIPNDRSDYAIEVSDKPGEARLVAVLRPADRPLPLPCTRNTDFGELTSTAGRSEKWGVRQIRVQVRR